MGCLKCLVIQVIITVLNTGTSQLRLCMCAFAHRWLQQVHTLMYSSRPDGIWCAHVLC